MSMMYRSKLDGDAEFNCVIFADQIWTPIVYRELSDTIVFKENVIYVFIIRFYVQFQKLFTVGDIYCKNFNPGF